MITVKNNAPHFEAMKRFTPNTAREMEVCWKEEGLYRGVHCRYIGKDARFQGRSAIIRKDEKGILCAQFDFKEPGVIDETDLVCFGWHAAWESDWEGVINIGDES